MNYDTCKIVSEMTYNVSSGTLNSTIPVITITTETYNNISVYFVDLAVVDNLENIQNNSRHHSAHCSKTDIFLVFSVSVGDS